MVSVYKILVRVGRDVKLGFDAIEMVEPDGKKAFVRMNALKVVDAEAGSVVADLNAKVVVLTYNGIIITSGIFFYKEVEGSYHFRCTTDLFMFDVYVLKDGQSELVFRPVE